jgi:hypothetical protein
VRAALTFGAKNPARFVPVELMHGSQKFCKARISDCSISIRHSTNIYTEESLSRIQSLEIPASLLGTYYLQQWASSLICAIRRSDRTTIRNHLSRRRPRPRNLLPQIEQRDIEVVLGGGACVTALVHAFPFAAIVQLPGCAKKSASCSTPSSTHQSYAHRVQVCLSNLLVGSGLKAAQFSLRYMRVLNLPTLTDFRIPMSAGAGRSSLRPATSLMRPNQVVTSDFAAQAIVLAIAVRKISFWRATRFEGEWFRDDTGVTGRSALPFFSWVQLSSAIGIAYQVDNHKVTRVVSNPIDFDFFGGNTDVELRGRDPLSLDDVLQDLFVAFRVIGGS